MTEYSSEVSLCYPELKRTGLLSAPLTVRATINPEKSLQWDPDLGPSSPSRTYRLIGTLLCWLVPQGA